VNRDYKEKLYRDYAIAFKNSSGSFDYQAADKWLPCLKYYLRDWFPQKLNAKITDLGCGDGRIIYALEKLGYSNVAGVDLSESQLNLAKQVSSNVRKLDVLDYLRGSEAEFDLIVSFDLIEHLDKESVLEFLRECFSSLTEGGRMIVQTPNAASPFFGSVRYGDFTHELAFTPNLLNQLMSQVGFTAISSREMPPVPLGYSLLSTLRFLAWRVIHMVFGFIDVIETGSRGTAIYTRVFVISGVK